MKQNLEKSKPEKIKISTETIIIVNFFVDEVSFKKKNRHRNEIGKRTRIIRVTIISIGFEVICSLIISFFGKKRLEKNETKKTPPIKIIKLYQKS